MSRLAGVEKSWSKRAQLQEQVTEFLRELKRYWEVRGSIGSEPEAEAEDKKEEEANTKNECDMSMVVECSKIDGKVNGSLNKSE
jgi:hypothetical protein